MFDEELSDAAAAARVAVGNLNRIISSSPRVPQVVGGLAGVILFLNRNFDLKDQEEIAFLSMLHDVMVGIGMKVPSADHEVAEFLNELGFLLIPVSGGAKPVRSDDLSSAQHICRALITITNNAESSPS